MQSVRGYLAQLLTPLWKLLRQGLDDPWERKFVIALLGASLMVGLLIFTAQVDLIVTIGGLAALVLGIVGMRAPKETWMRELAPELIGISIGVMAIDQLYQVRLDQQEKRAVLRQLGSRSHDFALDAARIVVERGWHRDGSLRMIRLSDAKLQNAYLEGANLQNAYLVRANLQNARLWGAKLQNTALEAANLQGADLADANLQNANLAGADLQDTVLENALYDDRTNWPDGFTPPDTALNWDQLGEEQREALIQKRWYLRDR